MQLGMIGLGRMGANLVRRLTKDGHSCVVYDVNAVTNVAIENDERGPVFGFTEYFQSKIDLFDVVGIAQS